MVVPPYVLIVVSGLKVTDRGGLEVRGDDFARFWGRRGESSAEEAMTRVMRPLTGTEEGEVEKSKLAHGLINASFPTVGTMYGRPTTGPAHDYLRLYLLKIW